MGEGSDSLILDTSGTISSAVDGGGAPSVALISTGASSTDVDEIILQGSGMSRLDLDLITNFELLTANGGNWTLSGSSSFDTIELNSGNFVLTGDLTGHTQLMSGTMLTIDGGQLSGNLTSSGDLILQANSQSGYRI